MRASRSSLSPRRRSRLRRVSRAFPTGRDRSWSAAINRRCRAGGWSADRCAFLGRSERCSCALGADPWLRRARSGATRSTSACQRVEGRHCARGPLGGQAPCRWSCLPHGRPSPWRTSQAAWAARLGGDPCAGRAGAARAARAVQPGRERVPTGAQAGVRPADRHRSGRGSCRTRRPAPARSGRQPQTDASHDPNGRRCTAARRFPSRSDLRYATALSPYHRTSIAPSR